MMGLYRFCLLSVAIAVISSSVACNSKMNVISAAPSGNSGPALSLLSTQRTTVTPVFEVSSLQPQDQVTLLHGADANCQGGVTLDKQTSSTTGVGQFEVPFLTGSRSLLSVRVRIVRASQSFCTGSADYQMPTLQGVSSVAAGDRYSCALMTDSTVKCWGV